MTMGTISASTSGLHYGVEHSRSRKGDSGGSCKSIDKIVKRGNAIALVRHNLSRQVDRE